MSSNALPPILKWAGGKRWLLPTLTQLYAPHRERRYVSLFAGGCADGFGLAPYHAVINDVNPHLINFYHWVKEGRNLPHPLPLVNEQSVYLQYRARFNALIKFDKQGSVEAAALFYYLNKAGYNGLCRFNKQGGYNVPFGKYKSLRFLPYSHAGQPLTMATYTRAMARWQIRCGDFSQVAIDEGDFIYADPPYDDGFTRYSAGGFTWHDQQRLIQFLATHPGPVVISNKATERIVTLYQDAGYKMEEAMAPRRISCSGDRTPVKEIIAWRNL